MGFDAYTTSGQGLNVYQPLVIQAKRDPVSVGNATTTFVDYVNPGGYPYIIDQKWLNTVSENYWRYQGQGIWVKDSSFPGPALMFPVPSGTSPVVADSSGNITLLNGTGISISGGLNSITITNDNIVAQNFVTDVNSPAIPSGSNLNIIGGESIINTMHGIRTDGSSGSNTVTIQLTNRLSGSVTTTNATPAAVITFPMTAGNLGSSTGVCTFDIQIAGYNLTDKQGVGYFISGSILTFGGSTSIIGIPDKVVNEGTGQTAADANLIASGNNAIIQVTGIAAKTIDWRSVATYVFVN